MQVRERSKIHTYEITDGALVQQTLAGDQRAFEMLVRRYNVPLFNFICHCLGDYDLACDVSQQVFLQLYISMPTLRIGEPLSGASAQSTSLNSKPPTMKTISHHWRLCPILAHCRKRSQSAMIFSALCIRRLRRCRLSFAP